MHVGKLPPQCALMCSTTAQIEELTVEGCLSGDPRMIYHAICYDPLTSAVLSLAEIQKMVDEMFEANRDYLPTFKHFR